MKTRVKPGFLVKLSNYRKEGPLFGPQAFLTAVLFLLEVAPFSSLLWGFSSGFA